MTGPKPFSGSFLILKMFTLHFTGLIELKTDILVNTWEFDPTYVVH